MIQALSVSVAKRDFWLVEMLSGLALIGWALLNIASPDRMSQENFGPLLHLAPDIFWECFALLVGLVQFNSVAVGSRRGRGIGACAAAYLNFIVVFNLLLRNLWPPGVIAYYLVFAGANLVAMFFDITREGAEGSLED